MQACTWRVIFGWSLTVGLLGCGSKPAAPQPIAAPMPPPVQAPGDGKVAALPAQSPAAKKSAAKKSAAVSESFPGESPTNVFVVASHGEAMTVLPTSVARPEDHLRVQSGVPGGNSTQLAVVAATAATASLPREDFKLPNGFTALPNYGYSELGLPRRIQCDKDDSMMALVSGGPTMVGTDRGPPEAMPQWTAFLDAFYLDVTEVTVSDFKKYQDELREQKKRVPLPPLNESSGGQYPALGISWGDAHGYVQRLGKELPTEVEFEKAARGPDGFHTPWGNGRAVWPKHRTPATITPVATFIGDQSVYGIFDLAGNAREWTNDFFDPKAYEEAAKQSAQRPLRNWTGPKKAATGTQRVIKGGAADWAAWNRAGSDMSVRLPDVGFRGVLRTPLSAGSDAPSTKSSKKAAS